MTRTIRLLMPLSWMVCLLVAATCLADEQAAQASNEDSQSRVVVRTLPDGTVQVVQVGADGEEKTQSAADDEDDGLEALAAIAQRLRMADAAEQGLDASSQPGAKTRQAPGRPSAGAPLSRAPLSRAPGHAPAHRRGSSTGPAAAPASGRRSPSDRNDDGRLDRGYGGSDDGPRGAVPGPEPRWTRRWILARWRGASADCSLAGRRKNVTPTTCGVSNMAPRGSGRPSRPLRPTKKSPMTTPVAKRRRS